MQFYKTGKAPELGSFTNDRLARILQRLYSPEIKAEIVTGDDAELGGKIDAEIKLLHDS